MLGGGCGCNTTKTEDVENKSLSSETKKAQMLRKVLNVDLLAIDLNVCKRCVPTGDELNDPRQSRGHIPVSPPRGPLKSALKGAVGVAYPNALDLNDSH